MFQERRRGAAKSVARACLPCDALVTRVVKSSTTHPCACLWHSGQHGGRETGTGHHVARRCTGHQQKHRQHTCSGTVHACVGPLATCFQALMPALGKGSLRRSVNSQSLIMLRPCHTCRVVWARGASGLGRGAEFAAAGPARPQQGRGEVA